MDEFSVRPFNFAAIFKMAAVPTEFLDRRLWQHLKWSIAADSLSSNTMNGAVDSQKNELLKKTERPQDFFR